MTFPMEEEKMPKSKARSRRVTPWDESSDLTPTQEFLKAHYLAHYIDRHPDLTSTHEEMLINEYVPRKCPLCQSPSFVKRGFTRNGVQRYKCDLCGGTFTPTTGTIFEDHKIAISEWMEYCLNLIRHVSINAGSWNNKNAFSTSKYWLKKVFVTLEDYQASIILGDVAWMDETYYPVIRSDQTFSSEGGKLHGPSTNQICIGVATDKTYTICFAEGLKKTSRKRTFETFKDHLKPGSTLVHDKETSHLRLVEELSLKSIEYDSESLKGLPDAENPLDPVNDVHDRLKKFLNAHSGFTRDDLQGYLDLFAFVRNPPYEPLEKVELLMKMAFENPKKLSYRDANRLK